MKKRFASKALCMLLTVAMLMSLCVSVSAAANTIVAKASSGTINPGGTVIITMSIKQAMEKFSGFNVKLEFDDNAFTFERAEWASAEIVGASINTVKELTASSADLDEPNVVGAGFAFTSARNFENIPANYNLVTFTFKAKEGYGGKYLFRIDSGNAELGYYEGSTETSLRGNLDFEDVYVIISGAKADAIAAVEAAYATHDKSDYSTSNWELLEQVKDSAIADINAAETEDEIEEIKDDAIAVMDAIPTGGNTGDDNTGGDNTGGDNTGGDNTGDGGNTGTGGGTGTTPTGPSITPPTYVGGGGGGGTTGSTGGGGGSTGGSTGGTGTGTGSTINDLEKTESGILINPNLKPQDIDSPEVTDVQLNAVEGLYTDMVDHWARAYVYDLSVVNGVFKGNGDGTFAPDIGITREEISVALGRLLGYEKRAAGIDTTTYTDNDTIEDWAKGYIAVMSEEGILLGHDDGSFEPKAVITREQLALILSRLVEKPTQVAEMRFVDVDKISDWAMEGCMIAYTYGIINGYLDNTFRGVNEVTRAEAATMIYNYIQVTDDVLNDDVADDITEIAEDAY